MKIVSIEPTPSPNTMKLTLDESLPEGQRHVYSLENRESSSEMIRRILDVSGVKSVFHVADFMAVERKAKGDWSLILAEIRTIFGEHSSIDSLSVKEVPPDSFGEIQVYVQEFKGIPMQLKLMIDHEERRVGLPERFLQAVSKIQSYSTNLIIERSWIEQGKRYGDVEKVMEELVEEYSAAYPGERLEQLISQVVQDKGGQRVKKIEWTLAEISEKMEDQDWRIRYAALQQMKPTEGTLKVLERAIKDSNVSIRRLATAYLGMIESPKALPSLYVMLEDASAVIRRTAGDAISDLGQPEAIPEMIKALKDKNKLVRWRAARFLYEVGDESALAFLKEAQNDSEFEVQLQISMAIERIERGEEASGTIWQQMTNTFRENES